MTSSALAAPRTGCGAAVRHLALAVLAIVVLAALPHALPGYWQTALVLLAINAILILGFRLVTTMGGWSFTHVALMGFGAYAMALLTTAGHSFWLALVVGPAASALVALLLAYPVLRTRQYYLFLSTVAAAEAIRQCFIQFSGITGGTYGIPFLRRPEPVLGFAFGSTTGFFDLVLVLLVAVAALLYAIDRSALGRDIKAVAANEELSESLGIDSFGHRAFALVAGSAIAGLAGVLLAAFNGIVGPSDFSALVMFKIIAAAIVGGTATLFGPVVGLVYLTALEEIFRGVPDLVPLLWGVSVIAVVLLLPGGLETLADRRSREAGR